MHDETRDNGTDRGPVDVLKHGLRVWAGEMRTLGAGLRTRFEISRLEKRLEQEYAHLGRIAEKPRGRKDDKELALQQIAFLKEEIEQLEAELARIHGEGPAKPKE